MTIITNRDMERFVNQKAPPVAIAGSVVRQVRNDDMNTINAGSCTTGLHHAFHREYLSQLKPKRRVKPRAMQTRSYEGLTRTPSCSWQRARQ